MSRILFCSQTQLDDIAHEQTIICRQLLAGYSVGSRPMKRKKNLHRMMNTILITFSNMCLLFPLNQISSCCRCSRKCSWYSTTVSCVGEKARCMKVKKPGNARDREMVMAVWSSVTWTVIYIWVIENCVLDSFVAWENKYFATPPLISLRNDVWETSAEIPYWWRVTIPRSG